MSTSSLSVLKNISNVYSYTSFLEMCQSLLAEGKTTSNSDQPVYVHFAKINLEKMLYWDLLDPIAEEMKLKIASLPAQIWYVITEGWCGDSAHILPVLAQMVQCNDRIELKIILRDTHPEAIGQYLTNGGKSIPKLIIEEAGEEKAVWGPRPLACQELYQELKDRQVKFSELEARVSEWYIADQGQSVIRELFQLTN